ncbi:MAG: helix-turn-helix domain-containing protein [Chitinophagaceae bacterium]
MKQIRTRSACPVSFSLDFVGDKWTLLILRDIVIHDKSTYGEFLGSNEGIATNILADRLSLLETNGFLTKEVGEDKKSKFIYSLTEKAVDLIPVIFELAIWGAKYNAPGPADLAKMLKKDKAGTIKKYQDKFRKN